VEEPRIVRLASVTSTQEVARGLPVGSIVVADHQTAGRGRLDRRWEAPPGSALLASFVLEPHPLLSLAAGVGAAEACGPDVRLKWPNDLMLRGRKLGGILVEVSRGKAVVGIGINLSAWTSASSSAILERWRELSVTLGRHVRVDMPGHTFEGMAQDIAEDGALVVDGQRVSAGDVIHLRQRGPAARFRAAPRRSARG